MTTEQAIRDAIEGGWKPDRPFLKNNAPDIRVAETLAQMLVQEILLDPLFWQALGKTMGWKTIDQCDECGKEQEECAKGNCSAFYHHDDDQVMEHWHSLIDHLAENKSIESFFENLQ